MTTTTTPEILVQLWTSTQSQYWAPIRVQVDNLADVVVEGYNRDWCKVRMSMTGSPALIKLAARWAALGNGTYSLT
jgi:hypothetical protein